MSGAENTNFRGRRFNMCRAIDDICSIIDHLGEEDGSNPPSPDRPFLPAPSEAIKLELKNQAALLLRVLILHNDGGPLSRSTLQRF